MEKITNDEITNADLKKFLNKKNNFIKDGWLYDIDTTIKTEYSYKAKINNKYVTQTSSIAECINNCTSPTGNTKKEKLESIFRAFSLFPMDKTRILILGKDPYPNPQKAQGLAFSHKEWDSIDASLLNIYKAIKAYKKGDFKFDEIDNKEIKGDKNSNPWETNLEIWAKNNRVLLLNTSLTYESNDQQNKHQAIWKTFIKNTIINILTSNSDKLVVFLWGADAQNLFFECINSFGINNCDYNLVNKTYSDKGETINITRKVLCLTTSHPSNNGGAVYKGFSKYAPNHFKACDEFLGEDIWKNFPENNQKNT